MIDYFNITIEIDHTSFGNVRTKKHENGGVTTKYFSKTLHINHVPFFVTSLKNGTQINIRCCQLKLFQGHNIFGNNSLKKLWCSLIVIHDIADTLINKYSLLFPHSLMSVHLALFITELADVIRPVVTNSTEYSTTAVKVLSDIHGESILNYYQLINKLLKEYPHV